MRRRSLTIVLALMLALSAPVGNASLETDCYFAGGYFDATYFAADYFDESVCVAPSSGSKQGSKGVTLPGVSIGI